MTELNLVSCMHMYLGTRCTACRNRDYRSTAVDTAVGPTAVSTRTPTGIEYGHEYGTFIRVRVLNLVLCPLTGIVPYYRCSGTLLKSHLPDIIPRGILA